MCISLLDYFFREYVWSFFLVFLTHFFDSLVCIFVFLLCSEMCALAYANCYLFFHFHWECGLFSLLSWGWPFFHSFLFVPESNLTCFCWLMPCLLVLCYLSSRRYLLVCHFTFSLILACLMYSFLHFLFLPLLAIFWLFIPVLCTCYMCSTACLLVLCEFLVDWHGYYLVFSYFCNVYLYSYYVCSSVCLFVLCELPV